MLKALTPCRKNSSYYLLAEKRLLWYAFTPAFYAFLQTGESTDSNLQWFDVQSPATSQTVRLMNAHSAKHFYLLPHAIQFAIGCHMPYSLLFVAARCAVFYICCCMPYNLLFVTACRTVCYFLPYAVQFAVCCHMPYSCYLMPHAVQLLFDAARHTVCYLLPHAIQLLFVATCRTVAICCHML